MEFREISFEDVAKSERERHKDIIRRTREKNKMIKQGISEEEAEYRLNNPNWKEERKLKKRIEQIKNNHCFNR